MEHIVQFAVVIDDNAIVKNIEEHAEKQIIETITQQVRNRLFQASYYSRNADEKSPLNDYSKNIIEGFLEKHKDEIIEKTAVHLAERLSRTKRAKEIIEEVGK